MCKCLKSQKKTWKIRMNIISSMCLLLLLSSTLYSARLSGVVLDTDKKALPAVEVTLKETGNQTATDSQGKFTLEVPDEWGQKTVVLVFKRQGYHTKEKETRLEGQEKVFQLLFIPQGNLLHNISVTAMNREQAPISVPMAQHVLPPLTIKEKIPETVMDTVSDTLGVHYIGSGGVSVTPTIRGLARRRVLVLVDGVRITSDRRAGTSANLVPPELSSGIEVVRSASSVLYGSDAIGGVVNIMTRPTFTSSRNDLGKNALNLCLGSVNKMVNSGFTLDRQWDKVNLYGAFQFTRADDYSSPNEKIYHSGYRNFSGMADISFTGDHRDFYLGYIGGFGQDVGKPSRDNDANVYTVVPNESDQIIRMGYREKGLFSGGDMQVSLFLNPTTYNLENIDANKDRWERSETESLNLGMKAYLDQAFGNSLGMQVGVEWFSRQNVSMINKVRPFSAAESETETTYPLENGVRNDYSLFLSLDYHGISRLRFHGGVRYTWFNIGADVSGVRMDKQSDSYSFFLGVVHQLSSSLSIFLNTGRAYRFPSLSESFYTGITGRKFVFGNPLLDPEYSFNIDGGIKWVSKNASLGVYLFSTWVDHMIERYKDQEGNYTYDNILRGRITGVEVEASIIPLSFLELFGHYFYYHGRSTDDDTPLNDLPAPRFLMGAKIFVDRLWVEIDYTHSFEKDDPGPAEEYNWAYNVVDVKGGIYLNPRFFLYLKVTNLFNEHYYPNPDPDIPYAKGISISTGLHLYF